MKIAKLQVSPELLRAVLMLPDDVNILNVRVTERFGELELTLEGEGLPCGDLQPGELFPHIKPWYRVTTHDCGHRTMHIQRYEVWGESRAESLFFHNAENDLVREYRKNPAQD